MSTSRSSAALDDQLLDPGIQDEARYHDQDEHPEQLLTERAGASIFLVTPRLALAALAFPAGLAAVAGLWPAWRAARLTPADAIRYL